MAEKYNEELSRQLPKPEKPIHFLQWHITHNCNLRCSHCYQEDYEQHMSKEDLFKTLDMYSDYVDQRGYQGQINITGGEPLVHPEFFNLCAEIKRRGYRLGILTNGTLIDEDIAGRLQKLQPVFVQISLDGTQEIHDVIRGTGAFESALHGIDLLKNHGVKVLVSFTAQKSNYKSFSKLASICWKHKVDKLWWDRVVTYSEKDAQELALSTEEFKELVKRSNRLRKKYKLFKGRGFVSVSRALQAADCRRDGAYICSAGHRLIIILSNGDVMPCRRLPFILGNVHDHDLTDIIKNSRLMRKLSFPRFPEGCKGCKRFLDCRGGARCVTYAQTGDLYVKDVNCFYHNV